MSDGDLAHILLIVDNEHRGPTAKSARRFAVPPSGHRRPLHEAAWQIYLDRRPLADRALDPQAAAGLPCQAVDLRKPQAAALARFLGGVERGCLIDRLAHRDPSAPAILGDDDALVQRFAEQRS